MLSKTCQTCNQSKEIDKFYKGQALCKECLKQKVKIYRQTSQGKEARKRERIKRRAKGIDNIIRATAQREYARRNPHKVKAQKLLQYAVKTGKIIKQPCEVCGDRNVQAHHEDYSQPYQIRWLCVLHHTQIHKEGFEVAK